MIVTRGLLAASLCALVLLPSLAEAKDATLSGYDVLTRPGRTVTLRAKLESEGFAGINPDVEEESLDFFVVGKDGKEFDAPKFVGSGETNDDGIAEVEWKPKDPGQYVLEARVRRGSDYIASPATLVVAAPPKARTIILIQIDGTVSTATNLKMFRGTDNEKILSIEGAKETLEILATHYQLVYLTDLERGFTEKFKDWLAMRQIPPAPIIFWDLFERSLSHKTYMRKLVAKLHQDFSMVTVGIGGDEDDGAAYVGNNLTGIVIGDDAEDLPPEVIGADRWADVVRHVTNNHRANALIKDAAGADRAKRAAALHELNLLGLPGIGYIHRFRSSTDPNLASAALLVCAKVQACETFYKGLRLSTANEALHSLLTAWKYGEKSIVVRLYKEREAGENDSMPVFDRCELVSRHEPEPAKVIFKVRLQGEGDPVEHTLVFQRLEDKTWRVHVEEF